MQTLLLTGDRGFIGSYLRQRLKGTYRIVGVSRSSGIDITDETSLLNIQEPIDTIIHSAAAVTEDFDTAYSVNVGGMHRLCRLAVEKGIKHFVYISTIFALPHPQNGYYNSYGKSKRIAEEVLLSYAEAYGFDVTILRLAQVYDDKRLAIRAQPMLYFFIDQITQKGEIALFGRRNPLRNYIHIDYVVKVVEEVVKEQKSGVWNVLEEQDHTIAEMAYMIFDIVNKPVRIDRLPDKPDIPSVFLPFENRYVSDTFEPIHLYEGLQRIIDYGK